MRMSRTLYQGTHSYRCGQVQTNHSTTSTNNRGVNGVLSKLLWLELVVTIGLDAINEILSSSGFDLPLGQIARGLFLVINLLVVFECGRKKDAQAAVLIIVFFAMMVFREVPLGLEAMANAALYWIKLLSFILTYLAIKCAGANGGIKPTQIESFFRWSIYVIPVLYITFALVGILPQRSIDAGYAGIIMSKNTMSATLLLLLVVSLYLSFEKRLSFIFTVVIIASLFLLGSKSTILFAAIAVAVCIIKIMTRFTLRNFILAGLVLTCALAALWLFRESVEQVIHAQLQTYAYVTSQQGGTVLDYLLTGRNDLLSAAIGSFVSHITPVSILFGDGVSSLGAAIADSTGYTGAYRGIEMDLFEITLAAGLIGGCIALAPFATAIKTVTRSGGLSANLYHVLGVSFLFCFMLFGGHVLTEGMPAEFVGIYLAYIQLLQADNRSDDKQVAANAPSDRLAIRSKTPLFE